VTTTLNEQERATLKRELFKGGFVSALFSLYKSRKKQAGAKGGKYLLQDMANDAGVTKAQVSRWFNGDEAPNWRLSTVYDIAEALDGEVHITITDRKTGEVHTAHGMEMPMHSVATTSGTTARRIVVTGAEITVSSWESFPAHAHRYPSGVYATATTVGGRTPHEYISSDRGGRNAA
jgi:hypothetical protein